jgi:transmembrane sensor
MPKNDIDKRYLAIAQKWLDGSATPEEKQEFDNWYDSSQNDEVIINEGHGKSDDQYRARLLFNIQQGISQQERQSFWSQRWYSRAVAAAVLFIMTGGAIAYYLISGAKIDVKTDLAQTTDVLPGGDKATLTLGDGSTLKLEKLADGAVKEEKGFIIRKSGGELSYELVRNQNPVLTYNTIRTPRGGQFRVVLPDGSKVWLNSESSLRYPTTFQGGERLVELTGEGYFEVTRFKSGNAATPFKINVNNKEVVEVLGTHFNIMAYSDEQNIRTTLLEGSVKVTKPGTDRSSILKPGQQSVYSPKTGFEINSHIDSNESISWKNGLITYRDADIQTIMRQIERWYDVSVIYDGDIPKRSFTGGISRNSRLSSVLKVLELNNIHFKLHEKQITVYP